MVDVDKPNGILSETSLHLKVSRPRTYFPEASIIICEDDLNLLHSRLYLPKKIHLEANKDFHYYKILSKHPKSRQFAYVRILSFKLCWESELGTRDIARLAGILKKQVRSRTLVIDLTGCTNFLVDGIKTLKYCISHQKLLTAVKLVFDWITHLPDESIYYLYRSLRGINSIQTLSIGISGFQGIRDPSFKYLSWILQSFPKLVNLSLGLTLCRFISDIGLKYLSEGFPSLNSLKRLSISILQNSFVSEVGMALVLKKLKRITSITELCLKFDSIKKALPLCDGLAQLLKSTYTLQVLDLAFHHHIKMTDESLKSLRDGMIPLAFLKSLTIQIFKCDNVSNMAFLYLKEAVITLTELEELNINIAMIQPINGITVTYMAEAIAPLSKLKKLTLGFPNCNNVTDVGLQKLGNILETKKPLVTLNLAFGCTKVTDKGVTSLHDALAALSNLKELGICLRECEATSQSLKSLADSLWNTTDLTHLDLDFSGNSHLDASGILELASLLGRLQKLAELKLNFAGCENITMDCIVALHRITRKFVHLEKLSMFFTKKLTMPPDEMMNFSADYANLKYFKLGFLQ